MGCAYTRPPSVTIAGRELVGSISVFFPAFNDASSLPELIARTFEVVRRRVPDDHEVIVVNDGSSDETGEVLERLAAQYGPSLRIITHPRNLGYGAALRSGFNAATKDWVFYTDGDGQYDPRELDLLLDAVRPGTGLVNGYKTSRSDPWHRIAIGSIYNRLSRAMFRIRIRDIDCDFRLIRRDLVESFELKSTSGSICIELIRNLELSDAEISEVPVSHYPRLHGRSQFFRLPSLMTTFVQLCRMIYGLVLTPAFNRKTETVRETSPSLAIWLGMAAAIVVASSIAYWRTIGLPFIADDYVQIDLGREYGPFSKWRDLALDPLYRCRATSIVMTYWTERFFGLSSTVFNLSSLLVHILNSFAVFLLGAWRPIGWRISAAAALVFAVSSHHQEAVVWYSALPELLVFLFAMSSFLCWVQWVKARSFVAYAGSFFLFLFALLSKESAVAVTLLMGVAVVLNERKVNWRIATIAPFALVSAIYFLMAYQSRSTHLHFNDGTFSLSAPFARVVANSAARLFWFWGVLAIVGLGYWRAWRWRTVAGIASTWVIATLLPYSFLTYMLRVPSRHMYFASVGMSLVVAAATMELWKRAGTRRGVAVAVLGLVMLLQNVGYMWTRKHGQFVLRAAPTEELIRIVDRTSEPVHLNCFPYADSVAILAVQQRARPENRWRPLHFENANAQHPNAIDLCNDVTGRGRF